MKKLLFYVFSSLAFLVISQPSTANMAEEYKNQSERSWENAQYTGKNISGQRVRIYLAKDGTWHYSSNGSFWLKGTGRVGYTHKRDGNTCYFGVNAQCLSNIVTTYTEIVQEGNELVQYTKTGTNGSPTRIVQGTLREGFTLKRKNRR